MIVLGMGSLVQALAAVGAAGMVAGAVSPAAAAGCAKAGR
jgi:hypothetical protein